MIIKKIFNYKDFIGFTIFTIDNYDQLNNLFIDFFEAYDIISPVINIIEFIDTNYLNEENSNFQFYLKLIKKLEKYEGCYVTCIDL